MRSPTPLTQRVGGIPNHRQDENKRHGTSHTLLTFGLIRNPAQSRPYFEKLLKKGYETYSKQSKNGSRRSLLVYKLGM